MKKLAVILVVALVVGIMLSSCHGQKSCPAYSQADDITIEVNV